MFAFLLEFFGSLLLGVLVRRLMTPVPVSDRTITIIRAIETPDIEECTAELALRLPPDLKWCHVKRAFRAATRRVVRWKKQNASRVARGLPPKPWPYHNKPFPLGGMTRPSIFRRFPICARGLFAWDWPIPRGRKSSSERNGLRGNSE